MQIVITSLPSLCPLPADYGSATSRAQTYNTPLEISEEEDIIRRNTTPAYRAPEVGLRGGQNGKGQGESQAGSIGEAEMEAEWE